MARIRIKTDGDRKQFKEGPVTLRSEAPPGTSDYQWSLNGQPVDGATNNQYPFTLSDDTAGEYAVSAKVAGNPETSSPVRISIEQPAASQPGSDPAGGGTAPPEDPPTFHLSLIHI